ncbi:FEKKY domain-containing protein [Chryseobacterium polytrichastri]|uniref:Uncharacterized protein n=1 Tax=Chryseobacterium polytrichastri TaxID=1302687 RepID=A0A1M6TLI9_9FLAO|nr:hypothetical protein [Chryseobacterium polytrichastri]SHK57638.1 hypothetical protein SAMN05444267_1005131 [Chryseobacterium polytrichastri]
MKNSKLFLLLIMVSISGVCFAQKNDEVKVTIKDKNGKRSAEILPHFIQFGIMSKNHQDFRKKYNVDVVYQNCVISPTLSKQAEKNNLALAKELTQKYGEAWKKDLGIIPYGL